MWLINLVYYLPYQVKNEVIEQLGLTFPCVQGIVYVCLSLASANGVSKILVF